MPADLAVAVIDVDLARYRRARYEDNISGLARTLGVDVREWVRFAGRVERPGALILAARDRTGAKKILAPSLAHLRNTHRLMTIWADIHVVGRLRTYPRGHRWTS